MKIVFFVLPVLGFEASLLLHEWFCSWVFACRLFHLSQCHAAVITVDEQALGGGPGLAHRVHLPEGSMMTEFVAAMEGLSLAPATTVNATVQPPWAADRPTDTASERFLSPEGPRAKVPRQNDPSTPVPPSGPPPGLRPTGASAPSAPWRASASHATAPAPDASAPDAAASAPRDPLVPEASRADVCAARWFDRVGRLNPILSMHESHAPAFAWHDPVMFLVKKSLVRTLWDRCQSQVT